MDHLAPVPCGRLDGVKSKATVHGAPQTIYGHCICHPLTVVTSWFLFSRQTLTEKLGRGTIRVRKIYAPLSAHFKTNETHLMSNVM